MQVPNLSICENVARLTADPAPKMGIPSAQWYGKRMPLAPSTFAPRWYLRSGHIQSMVPALFRRVPLPPYRRERLELVDGDFLDLDWLDGGYARTAIISHGLEGSSRRDYVTGAATALFANGWNVVAWNMRGCSGTPNRLLSWYHSGQSADLSTVVDHVLSRKRSILALVGFSIGGNITLKYVGERSNSLPDAICCAVALSVPVDLASSAQELARRRNRLYMRYLLDPLFRRIEEKAARFPGQIDTRNLRRIKTFREFDSLFTAPIHGFSSVDEYWERSSSAQFLGRISIPTLLINARNDPFLTPQCFPEDVARRSTTIELEVPESGGHVGFIASTQWLSTWADERIVAYLNNSAPAQRLPLANDA